MRTRSKTAGKLASLRTTIVVLALVTASLDAAAERASWSFVQSVGGLALGEARRERSGWLLPVHADVSGLRKVTVPPTMPNSGVACIETLAAVEGTTIAISIVTGLAGKGRSSQCPAAQLGVLAPGRYDVVYRAGSEAPVPLGSIVIAP